MSKEIEENIKLCEEILDRLAKLSDSESNKIDANIWLMLDDLNNKTMEMQSLYRQIIT